MPRLSAECLTGNNTSNGNNMILYSSAAIATATTLVVALLGAAVLLSDPGVFQEFTPAVTLAGTKSNDFEVRVRAGATSRDITAVPEGEDSISWEARRLADATTGGVPGEGLFLFVANSDQQNTEIPPGVGEADYPDGFGTGSGENGRHKPLQPLDRWDYSTLVLASCGLMIAAAGGIGGGGILVPLYILVLRFGPKHAVPLSNITIFGGAITNSYLNMKKRHPIADRPLVDWDLILVMEPLTIGGALVGSFIQKVLPEVFLTFMMIALLVATADRTLRKGIKNFKKESAQNQERKKGFSGSTSDGHATTKKMKGSSVNGEGLLTGASKALKSYGAAEKDGFSPALLAPELQQDAGSAVAVVIGDNQDLQDEPSRSLSAPKDTVTASDNDAESAPILVPSTAPNSPSVKSDVDSEMTLKDILDEERHTSVAKVGIMSAVFVVILAVNILKGGGGFESPLGIECGSLSFWMATVGSFAWVLAVSLRVRKYLVGRWEMKSKLGYVYTEGDVQWSPVNTLRYPGICFFAGFFAGMFGVGGGIVKGPLMLEMGVHPMVASATSAVMILYTSFTASTSFVVFGLLRMDYAVPLFAVGVIATAFGQWGTDYLVQKFQRPSFIILSIGSCVALSAVLMGYNGLLDIYTHWGVAAGAEGENGLCTAGV